MLMNIASNVLGVLWKEKNCCDYPSEYRFIEHGSSQCHVTLFYVRFNVFLRFI
jgi:hypothetical protein